MLSPYLAWFSMPVPVQHQKLSSGVLYVFVRSGAKRHVVAHHARLGVLRGEDVVVQGPLVIVGVLGLRVPAEQVPGELEHVVGVAGLAGGRAEGLRRAFLWAKSSPSLLPPMT